MVRSERMTMLKTLTILLLAFALMACGQGYTQEEVDALVADAVESAVAQAQDDFVSEAEAQAQVEAAERQASLTAAVDECVVADPFITVDSGGLFMESRGNESPGTSYARIACVLAELETPDSVVRRIENTNSTMGLVKGEWGVYEAEWSYHPDNGLAISVRVAG